MTENIGIYPKSTQKQKQKQNGFEATLPLANLKIEIRNKKRPSSQTN